MFQYSHHVPGNTKQDAVTTAPEAAVAAEVSTAAAEVEAAVTEAAEVVSSTEATGPSRFCKCVKLECNCCREFRLPVLPISSSGE